MADEKKKISFGFSKSSKQALLPKSNKLSRENGIQYIDCLESKSIKVKDSAPKEDIRELIIPVRNNTVGSQNNITIHKTVSDNDSNTATSSTNTNTGDPESLDAIAAREIIEDLQKKNDVKKNVLTLPVVDHTNSVSDRAPTLDDYDAVPVTDFGMAMLRGMGWCPGKGIGKTEKLAPNSALPVLRPKGMGLGADKLASAPTTDVNGTEEEEVKVQKNAFVKVNAGIHKDLYGQVEGFDEDGRVIIKSALGKNSVSVLECIVSVVTENEYKRHSRVLNLSQYEEQKRKDYDKGKEYSEHKRKRTENK